MLDPIRKDLIIVELKDEIDLGSFQCENNELNEFLHEKARFNEKNLISKIYLYYHLKSKKVVGFITLSNYMLRLAESKKFGIQKVPAALIGRIAINNEYRGYNLGRDLILFARGRCNYIKDFIGCRLLVVEAKKDDPIVKYLASFGFEFLHESKGFIILGFDLLI